MCLNFNQRKSTMRPLFDSPATLILLLMAIAATAVAQPAFADQPPKPLWRVVDDDCQQKNLRHRRESTPDGSCDYFKSFCGQGSFAHAAIPVTPVSVISELRVEVPLRSTKTGHQVLARVVLPRSTDPETGLPITMMIPGTSYNTPGEWQTVVLSGLDTKVAHHVRLLRTRVKTSVDPRQAYVDHIVVNAFGGPGVTELWIRDPELSGVARYEPTLSQPSFSRDEPASAGVVRKKHGLNATPVSFATSPGMRQKRRGVIEARLRMEGNILYLHDRPFFARVIQANGEDWSFLKGLGFNVIQLDATPTVAEIRAAEELDLWLIAPPPRNWTGEDLAGPFRRVIIWHLGDQFTAGQIRNANEWLDSVRDADRRTPRPIACKVASHSGISLPGYAKLVDIVIHESVPTASKANAHGSQVWMKDQITATGSAVASWATINTQPSESIGLQDLAMQSAALRPEDAVHSMGVSGVELYEQVMALASCGTRGFVCRSSERLDSNSQSAATRCGALRLANHELQSLTPWLAGGHICDEATIAGAGFSMTAWQTDRAWLVSLEPLSADEPIHSRVPQSTSGPKQLKITVPGAAESACAMTANRGALERLTPQRVAGGCQFEFQAIDRKFLFIASDPRVARSIGNRLRSPSKTAIEWKYELARRAWNLATTTRRQMPVSFDGAMGLDQRMNTVAQFLERADEQLAASNHEAVDANAVAALREMQRINRQMMATTRRLSSFTSPYSQSLGNLAAHWQLHNRFGATIMRLGQSDEHELENLLPEAAMEDLNQLQWNDWKTFTANKSPNSSAHTARSPSPAMVSVTSDSPRQGVACLRMDGADAPLWVTSRDVDIPPRQIVSISGYVRVMQPLQSPNHQIAIHDSIGGQELAINVDSDSPDKLGEWQRFSFVRATGSAETISLKFLLHGPAQVDFDDVRITILE